MPADVEYYAELGYPMMNLPKPGYLVTRLDIANTVKPILTGVESLISAMVEAHLNGAISPEAAAHGLELLAGQLQDAIHIFDRWYESPEIQPRLGKKKTEPTHGS
jgi:hypothetical protein